MMTLCNKEQQAHEVDVGSERPRLRPDVYGL